MYYKLSDPTLFSRDYIFQDDRYFRFYTPSFLALVRIAATFTGDYFHGVALLQAPLLVAYLIAAYALFWQASRSRAIALVFSLLSTVGVSVVIDFWRVNGLGSMLPRTIVLPLVALATLLLTRYLNPTSVEQHFNGEAWWHWLVLGTVIGTAANLHPTTGITLALAAGIVATAARRHNRNPTLPHLLMLITGAFIAAVPIVLNVVSGSNTELTSADFESFVSAFQARISMPPYSDSRLEALTQEWLYLLGFLWLLLTLVLWFLAKLNRRSWAALLFVGVQLTYVWLLVKNPDEYLDALMVIVAGGFFAWRWWAQDEEREMLFYEMIAAIVGVSFVLPLLLRVVWLELEIWSLTTIVAEMSRGARLLTIPFYLIGSRLALHLAQQPKQRDTLWLIFVAVLAILVPLSGWHVVLLLVFIFQARLRSYTAIYAGLVTAVSAYIVYQIVTRADATLVAVIAGVYVAAAVFVLSRLRVPQPAVFILIGAGIAIAGLTALNVVSPINFTNDSPWYTFALRGSPDFVTFLLGSATGLGLWTIFHLTLNPSSLSGERLSGGRSLTRWSVGDRLRRFDLFTWLVVSLVAVMAIQTVGLIRFSLRAADPGLTPALVQAAQWAEANTAPGALFFDTAGNGSQFRLWSQRSITHGWKELGLVGYARPTDLASMLERYQRIIAASEAPNDVLAMAEELNADYIIRSDVSPLDLPEVYRNDELVIYQVTNNVN